MTIPSKEPTPVKFDNKTVEIVSVYQNTSQEIVEITTDRLRLVLVEHRQGFERKKEWQTPLGILVTILLVFTTTDFKKAWGFEATFWQALFMMLVILCFTWFIQAVYVAYKSPTISDVMERIKKSP